MFFRVFFCILAILAGAKMSMAEDATSSGTAFAITTDGWLLTNAHVVRDCRRVEVTGLGTVTEIRQDEINDLAMIKVRTGKALTPITLRKSPVRLGEDIVVLGYPLADILSPYVKLTTGNVNALAGVANDARYIQISSPIQPGNSGGPVVDRDGFLVGIATATLSKQMTDKMGINTQNVNFAIRASVAEIFLQAQSVKTVSGDRQAGQAQPATADLAERVAPSVFQALCYGAPVEQAAAGIGKTPASAPVMAPATLLEAAGYDAIGFDYSFLKNISYQDCRAACMDDGRCKAITYNTKYSACFLKDNVAALIRNADALAGYSSEKAADIVMSSFTSFSNVDLPGGDYKRYTQSNYLSCFTACAGDNECRAFAYVPKKGECWLKNSVNRPRAKRGVELGVK
jgi:serine protease Do